MVGMIPSLRAVRKLRPVLFVIFRPISVSASHALWPFIHNLISHYSVITCALVRHIPMVDVSPYVAAALLNNLRLDRAVIEG
jgi:hypothetical protein